VAIDTTSDAAQDGDDARPDRPDAPAPLGVRVLRPLGDFLRQEAGAGVLLVTAAIVAMVWANSPWSAAYTDLWSTQVTLGVGERTLDLTLREWINDLGMVLFFFVAGLEIKRELTQGELRDPRQASLPIIAAVGGMVVPATIYAVLNAGGPGSSGWGIPMATDIAIVTGVVALLGRRAPSWLKLFLLALAIVDDIGAIIVIAIFYSDGVSLSWLAVAIGSVVAAAAVRSRVDRIGVYLAFGGVCWFALHEAHVHPTLTGVAFGMLAPVIARRDSTFIDADELALPPSAASALRVSQQARGSVSVVEWLEHQLHPWSAFLIVPLFALANAGISLPADALGDAFTNRVTWGVILGLVVGKTVGVAAATLIAVALGVGRLPAGVTPRYVVGAAALAGIGFTVSLFVTELAFGDSALGNDARLGVVIASLVAAVIGTAICLPGTVDED
jgi:Na+:H+ antiporter, NhaA family